MKAYLVDIMQTGNNERRKGNSKMKGLVFDDASKGRVLHAVPSSKVSVVHSMFNVQQSECEAVDTKIVA